MDGFDYSELVEFQERMKKAREIIKHEFMEAAKEIAVEFLNEVKEKTPIGDTKQLSDKWRSRVYSSGHDYIILIYNPMEYASYVEDGHRTRKGKGKKASRINSKFWVEGRFMLKLTQDDIEQRIPDFLNRVEQKLVEVLDGL